MTVERYGSRGRHTRYSWKSVEEFTEDTLVVMPDNSGCNWSGEGSFEEGYVIGQLIGNGTFSSGYAKLSLWQFKNRTTFSEEEFIREWSKKNYLRDLEEDKSRETDGYIVKYLCCAGLTETARKYGVFPKDKAVYEKV